MFKLPLPVLSCPRNSPLFAIPAKAGTYFSAVPDLDEWTPAFAGVSTMKVRYVFASRL
jgi:hypothetical protein